jgi:hypothetical protein
MRAHEFITEHRLVFKKSPKGKLTMRWRCETGPRKGRTVPDVKQCSASPDIKKAAKMKQTRKRTKVAQARKTKKTKRVNPMSRTAAMLNKKMREGLREDTTSLNQIYQNDFPDRDEAFWDYVTNSELNNQYEIQTMQPYKLEILLKGQYRIEHIDELYDIMEPEQQEVVDDYMNSNLSNQVIVIADGRIIDGNHRALAAVKSKQPIKYIDLDDIEEPLQENIVRGYDTFNFKQNVFENLSQYRRWAQSPKHSKRGMTRHYVDRYETVVRPELAESTGSFNTRKKEATAFNKSFKAIDERDGVAIEVGESISVLSTVVVPSDKTSHIEVSGFVNPKQITKINLDTDNKIDTIEFSDGSIFPEAAEFTTVGGVSITNTVFFPDYTSASKAYTALWMMLTSMEGRGWKVENYMNK